MKTREKIMVVGILLVILTTASANAGLVAHWAFDEGSGTTAQDSTINGNDGTLVNGPGWTSGKINGGLSFDGTDDYVDVSDNPSLRFTCSDSFTIAFWAKPSGIDQGFVVSKMRTGGANSVFGYQVYWSPLGQWIFLVDKAGQGQTYLHTSENSAPEDNWYHVAAVYDNKDMKIYLNGQLDGHTVFAYDTGNTTPDKNLAIGVRSFDTVLEQYFKGKAR
ncbi:MAG: LamG domain-containing protein [Planctomycetota bacterium]|nr:LamG domain-containing protein [Planctomycetota bacterium]